MTIPTKPGRRIRLLVAAVALAVGGLVAAYFVVSSPSTREAPAPTVVATPASAPTTDLPRPRGRWPPARRRAPRPPPTPRRGRRPGSARTLGR